MPAAIHPDHLVPPALRDAILAWYDATGRSLAFRATRNPYAILVSELMAQQTQAARAASAWTAWMARFPTVQALAQAPVADVLRAWAGLGYNRRAVMLHRAAKAIVADHGGEVPSTIEGLQSLPGVGAYTARAVAAIAFGRPVGAVDTNVRRVLGRVVAGGAEAMTPGAIQALADASVPADRAADWTHALMDLGAGPCRARAPRCPECPASAWCRYAAGDRPAQAAAPGTRAPGRARRPEPPFPATTRWLRGRILARARDAEDGDSGDSGDGDSGDRDSGGGDSGGGWTTFGDAMGSHSRRAVREAVAALASEGLLEARETGGVPEARLPRS